MKSLRILSLPSLNIVYIHNKQKYRHLRINCYVSPQGLVALPSLNIVYIHNNYIEISSPENEPALSADCTKMSFKSMYKDAGFNYVYFHLISLLLCTSSAELLLNVQMSICQFELSLRTNMVCLRQSVFIISKSQISLVNTQQLSNTM